MAIDKAIAKAILGNGKRAVKNGVINGINGNGFKNGAQNGLAKEAFVNQHLAKRAAQSNPEVLIEAGVAETVIPPSRNYVQQQVNRYQPGGVTRANRGTQKIAPHSVIYSEAQGLKAAYPELEGEIEDYVRGGYSYARNKNTGTPTQPMKGYPNFIGPDGRAWRLKPKQRYGAGYRLSAIEKKKLYGYGSVRASRESPWNKEEQRALILRALTRVGKAHKFEQLIQIMKSDYKKMKASLGGLSKGHLVSLEDGGIDVAENIVPQQLRNTRQKIDGKWIVVKGNAAMQADSTELLVGKGISSWDDYVRLKLSQL